MGSRIAEVRKVHGATQRALAMRANVSYSLLRKVERGERAASPSFVAAVARALSINTTDLTEQPYWSHNASPASEQGGVPALRQALVEGDDPDSDTAPRSLDDLRVAVAGVKDDDRGTRHAQVVRALPDALRHLHRASRDVRSGRRAAAHELLGAAYSYAAGLRSLDRASSLVDLAPARPAAAAVRGAVHLRSAIVAARTTDADRADWHLNQAKALTAPGQESANFYGTKFGMPNVDIHRVAVPVELADGVTAVGRAASIRLPKDTAPSRTGHYWIDLARGWLLYGDRRRALDSLQTARRIAPQLTRYHPQVHETVQSLAGTDAHASNSLAGFAAWCGCPPLTRVGS
jgi:transcriptional regulator with XRE-family HTH domain